MEICLDTNTPEYVRTLVAFALGVCVLAIGALAHATARIRRAVLGEQLLEACAGDWLAARTAIDTTRQATELMTHRDPRVRRRWFTRDP